MTTHPLDATEELLPTEDPALASPELDLDALA